MNEGVRELDSKKLPDLLELKYDSIPDAVAQLGNVKDIRDMIRNKPHNVELVLTGRSCPRALLKEADLVTEMREIKHPYAKGITARRGIEC